MTVGFNPRPRRGGDSSFSSVKPQSSPRRGGDLTSGVNPRNAVSIHAPAGGATRPARSTGFNQPPQGLAPAGLPRQSFQSTPPQGGRRHNGYGRAASLNVSIHAPAGGATRHHPRSTWNESAVGATALNTNSPKCFNPRPRRGGDPCCLSRYCRENPRHLAVLAGEHEFQSTPPQGGRRRDYNFL